MALQGVDAEDKHQHSLGLRGRAPWLITESGLYGLILRSRKPEARAFSRWVTKEVLPSIRRNGVYMTKEVAVMATEGPAVFLPCPAKSI